VSHRYSYFYWWWAHSCPKHVEKRNKHARKNCAPSWFYLHGYKRTHVQQNIKFDSPSVCNLFDVVLDKCFVSRVWIRRECAKARLRFCFLMRKAYTKSKLAEHEVTKAQDFKRHVFIKLHDPQKVEDTRMKPSLKTFKWWYIHCEILYDRNGDVTWYKFLSYSQNFPKKPKTTHFVNVVRCTNFLKRRGRIHTGLKFLKEQVL